MINASNFNNGLPDATIFPLSAEKHIQGLSGSLGVDYFNPKLRVGISYVPALRHDYIYTTSLGEPNTRSNELWDFLPEHHLHVFRTFRFSAKDKRRVYAGAGLGIINAGRSYFITKEIGNGRTRGIANDFWLNMQFVTVEGRLGIPLGNHFWVESLVSVIPKTFPTDKLQNYATLSLTLRYNIRKNAFQ